MPRLSPADRRALGLRAARTQMYVQDKVWSRYSNDKVDIAHHLAAVIRRLVKSLPLGRPLRALSIGSSNEPQFRILESAFRGGLYLLDIEEAALDVVDERIARQATDHVHPFAATTGRCSATRAAPIASAARGSAAAACSSSRCTTRCTTATKHPGCRCWAGSSRRSSPAAADGADGGDPRRADGESVARSPLDDVALQPLRRHVLRRAERPGSAPFRPRACAAIRVCRRRGRRGAQPRAVAHRDFEAFMGVIWMILLHPTVHRFSRARSST